MSNARRVGVVFLSLLSSACATRSVQMDQNTYYDQQYSMLVSETVAVVSDGCVLRDQIGEDYFVRDPSQAVADSVGNAAVAYLKSRGMRVSILVTPFACAVKVPVNSVLDLVADKADATPARIRLPIPLIDAVKTDPKLAEAYQQLIAKTVSAIVTAEDKTGKPERTLQLSDAHIALLRNALGVRKVWVLRGGGVQVSSGKSVVSAVATSGEALGLAAPSNGYGYDIALMDLQLQKVLWKKRLAVPGGDPSTEVVYDSEWARTLFSPLLPADGRVTVSAPARPVTASVAKMPPAGAAKAELVTLAPTPLRRRPQTSDAPFAQLLAGAKVELVSSIKNDAGSWSFVRTTLGQGWVPANSLVGSP